MSGWRSFITGWSFRTPTPAFEPGQRIDAYITDYDDAAQTGTARIGDTVLTVRGVDAGQIEQIVPMRITTFDTSAHRGEAELVD